MTCAHFGQAKIYNTSQVHAQIKAKRNRKLSQEACDNLQIHLAGALVFQRNMITSVLYELTLKCFQLSEFYLYWPLVTVAIE